MFITKNRQNTTVIVLTKSQNGGVFELLGRWSLRVMTSVNIFSLTMGSSADEVALLEFYKFYPKGRNERNY